MPACIEGDRAGAACGGKGLGDREMLGIRLVHDRQRPSPLALNAFLVSASNSAPSTPPPIGSVAIASAGVQVEDRHLLVRTGREASAMRGIYARGRSVHRNPEAASGRRLAVRWASSDTISLVFSIFTYTFPAPSARAASGAP